jgi:hypothetical protein
MDMEWISKDLRFVATSIASVIVIIGAWFKFRTRVRDWCKAAFRIDAIDVMSSNFAEVVSDVKVLKDQVDKLGISSALVEAEVRFNGGGSSKDRICMLVREREIDFRMRPQPSFQCSETGGNVRVSYAYVELVGCQSAEELKEFSWESFVDPRDVHGYSELWERAFEIKSGFVTSVRLRDKNQLPRGKWVIKVIPVAPYNTEEGALGFLFNGYLTPTDDVARKIWDENFWRV